MIAPMRARGFVYGTLRRGEPNHHLLDGCAFVGAGRTEPRFTLVSLGAFPALVAGGETAVRGEVYEVDVATLAALDRLEEHPDFYQRRRIRLEGGEEVVVYVLPRELARGYPAILSGDWRGAGTSHGA